MSDGQKEQLKLHHLQPAPGSKRSGCGSDAARVVGAARPPVGAPRASRPATRCARLRGRPDSALPATPQAEGVHAPNKEEYAIVNLGRSPTPSAPGRRWPRRAAGAGDSSGTGAGSRCSPRATSGRPSPCGPTRSARPLRPRSSRPAGSVELVEGEWPPPHSALQPAASRYDVTSRTRRSPPHECPVDLSPHVRGSRIFARRSSSRWRCSWSTGSAPTCRFPAPTSRRSAVRRSEQQGGHLRAAQPVLGRCPRAVLGVRARDPALHHRLDHHAAADGGHPQAAGAAGGGPVRSEGHHPVDPLPHGGPGPDPVDRLHLPVPRGRQLTGGIDFIPKYAWWNVGLIVLTMTAGTAFVMWLGELITQRGVGNGMSLLIFVSILSQFPFGVRPDLGPDRRQPELGRLHRDHAGVPAHDRGDHLRGPGPAPDPDPVRQAGPRPPHDGRQAPTSRSRSTPPA
jgi:hypothetical protein